MDFDRNQLIVDIDNLLNSLGDLKTFFKAVDFEDDALVDGLAHLQKGALEMAKNVEGLITMAM